jgi:hypothetical protein
MNTQPAAKPPTNLELEAACRAGEVLSMVLEHQESAYAAAIARRIHASFPKGPPRDLDPPEPVRAGYLVENEVGMALRFLEKNGLLISNLIKHPSGHSSKVRLYELTMWELTMWGAFMISLAGRLPKTPLSKVV